MSVDNIIRRFREISLFEMDEVKLMNRTDRKFWFHSDLIDEILEEIEEEYFVLEIEGDRLLPYLTTYYDTESDEMYNNHHRGKLNRYKVRRRNYAKTDSSFLEVKFKSNKGRTVKVRRESDYYNDKFDNSDEDFLRDNTPYLPNRLHKVLENSFKRLMLVGKAMNERCTIDNGIQFVCGDNQVKMDNLVVVEVKSDGRNHSAIIDALKRRRLKSSGFSKYCIGRSLVDDSLKINNFKGKQREIVKKIDNQIKIF